MMTEVSSATGPARGRDVITDSLRYWEPRRIPYNIVLAAVVLGYFIAAWPASRAAVTLNGVLFLFMLGVLANVCYCAAYLADVFVQLSGFEAAWHRWRWALFAIGTAFAGAITRIFAFGFFSTS
jgi:hypothetical protein